MNDLYYQQMNLIDEIRYPPGKENCQIENSHVYSQLIFRKIERFLSNCFPLSQQLLGEFWSRTITQFIADYECYSPYHTDIPKQFCDFVLADYLYLEDTPDNLQDLVYFEWLQFDLRLRSQDKHNDRNLPIQQIKSLTPQIKARTELWQSHWNSHLLNAENTTFEYSDSAFQLIFSIDANQNIGIYETTEDSAKLYEFIAENILFDCYQIAEEFCILMGMDNPQSIDLVLQEIQTFYQQQIITLE